MTHKVSPHGVVGLGALGQAIEEILQRGNLSAPGAVFFTTKAFDLGAALLEQHHHWPQHLPFITLSNGHILPLLQKIESKIYPRPIRIGMTTIGARIHDNGHVVASLEGSITCWGPIQIQIQTPRMQKLNSDTQNSKTDSIASSFRVSELELTLLKLFPKGAWNDDMSPILFQKWIVNTVVNSLTAVHQLPANGNLLNHLPEVHDLLSEAYALAQKLWPDLNSHPTERELLEFLMTVIQNTAHNENSMARDIRLRRKTESDFLAGQAINFDGFVKLKLVHQQILKLTTTTPP